MASNLPISFSDFLRITSANTGESQKILDAYSDLRVGEEFLGAYRKGELRKFTDADGEILQKAVDTLRKSLTGEYDQFAGNTDLFYQTFSKNFVDRVLTP